MANPFPGMDPYLEGDLWTSVHTDLCGEIARQLAPKVKPKYMVFSIRRVILAPPENGDWEQHRFPDVGVLSTASAQEPGGARLATAPLQFAVDFSEPIPQVSLEIREVAERRLVTSIEVLSPTNKHGPGRDEYDGKRLQLLASTAHLVEIDLLRVGARFPTREPLPACPYFVFVNRVEQRGKVEVWPIQLEEPLPTVKVPLLPGDDDVPLDLQQALTTIYSIFSYDDALDYRQPPRGPLTPQQAAWIAQRLQAQGRRQADRQ